MKDCIISALVGLVGACGNNGKTESTDIIVMKALQNIFSDVDEEKAALEVQKEKYAISPNCKTCKIPCGNTSDYDMEKFYANQDLKEIKEELLREVAALAGRLLKAGKMELPDVAYQAISYFGYDLVEESYENLIEIIKNTEA